MAEFDPIRALREEISGLADIRGTLVRRQQELSIRYGELEIELNMVQKLRGFADVILNEKREALRKLET